MTAPVDGAVYYTYIHVCNCIAFHSEVEQCLSFDESILFLISVADPGIDGRGREREVGALPAGMGVWEQHPQRGCRRQSPLAGGPRGQSPQKLKPKDGLDAS